MLSLTQTQAISLITKPEPSRYWDEQIPSPKPFLRPADSGFICKKFGGWSLRAYGKSGI